MAHQASTPLYDAYKLRRKLQEKVKFHEDAVRHARTVWQRAQKGQADRNGIELSERAAAMSLYMATIQYEAAKSACAEQEKLVFITHALHGTNATYFRSFVS